MATGNIIKVYSRGTRNATSKIGKIQSGKSVLEFTESDLNKGILNKLQKGLDEFDVEKDRYLVMKGWDVEFESEGRSRIADGTLKRKK